MSTKKTTAKKASKAAKPQVSKKAAAKKTGAKAKAPRKREGKMSALDAAAQVLASAKEPMNTKAMIETMAAKGLWTTPGGKTPAATLYAAILREINEKGAEARFAKVDRGQFALRGSGVKAAKKAPKATGKKAAKKAAKKASAKPADGTPGPKAVSELFKI
jgi:hypothetical protein